MEKKYCKYCGKELLVENFNFPYLYRQAIYCNSDCKKKGHPPWNKGVKGYTTKAKGKKMDDSYREQCKSRATGVKQSAETIKKRTDKNRGQKRTSEQILRMSLAQRGEKSHNWRGGRSSGKYPVGWTETLRRSIRERDGYMCQMPGCNKPQGDIAHSVHHIDYNKKNLNPNNLITLCKSCHAKTNYKREYWETFFLRMPVLIYF